MELRFYFEKETKNTIRFQEDVSDGAPVIGSLYVQKDYLDDIGYVDEDSVLVVNIECE